MLSVPYSAQEILRRAVESGGVLLVEPSVVFWLAMCTDVSEIETSLGSVSAQNKEVFTRGVCTARGSLAK